MPETTWEDRITEAMGAFGGRASLKEICTYIEEHCDLEPRYFEPHGKRHKPRYRRIVSATLVDLVKRQVVIRTGRAQYALPGLELV